MSGVVRPPEKREEQHNTSAATKEGPFRKEEEKALLWCHFRESLSLSALHHIRQKENHLGKEGHEEGKGYHHGDEGEDRL